MDDMDSTSDLEPDPVGPDVKKKVVRHSLAQKTHLEYLYSTGMTSCSKDKSFLVQKAAKDTGLSLDQVKV